MIDVRSLVAHVYLALAVEAPPLLHFAQNRQVDRQRSTLTAEKELIQIGGRAEHILILATDVAHPGPTYQIGHQPVKLSEAEHHARLQLNGNARAHPPVQELQRLVANDL